VNKLDIINRGSVTDEQTNI